MIIRLKRRRGDEKEKVGGGSDDLSPLDQFPYHVV